MEHRYIDVQPLTPTIGAVVEGVDLANDASDDVYDEINTALWTHHVIFFRGQNLSPADHSRLGSHFGEVTPHEFMRPVEGQPEVHITDHDDVGPSGNASWHTDVTFRKRPTLVTLLQAKELPPAGGDTLRASTGAAFDALPDPMKTMLLGLRAEHDFAHHMRIFWSGWGSRYDNSEAELEKEFRQIRDNPIATHPAVINHPVTGRLSLFVNSNWTKKFVGMELGLSEKLLALVNDWIKKPEFQVRYRWEKGDIGIFDNFARQHYAVLDYEPHYRAMQRVIAGTAVPILDLATVPAHLRPPQASEKRHAAE